MSLVSKNNVATNKYELEIHVPADEFEKACQNAYLKRVKKIEVPGFRKGKAPRKTIEKLYGEGIFFEDAINTVYPVALEAAVEEAGLELVARPMVDVTDVSKEDGFKFKATCVVKPEVSVKNYKGIKVSKEVKDVTDEDINQEIDRLRNRNARTISVSDRAAQNDDIVVIDFDGSVDGVPFDGGKAEKFELTLGSGQFIPGFEIDEVIANMEGEIPEEMYENRINEMVRDFDYRLRSQGMDINVYLQYTGMDMDAFRLTFKEQAEKQVKIRLALEKVVELEKIETTDEDLEKEYQRIADSYSMDLDKVKNMIPAADLLADVAVNKAVDLIKDSAVKA